MQQTQQAALLLRSCESALNAIPNKRIDISGYRNSYDLAAALGHYIRNDEPQYNNATFKEKMKDEFSNYANLAYSIERDEEKNVWELNVHSSSMSELDGSEEGPLGIYSYQKCREIIEDIQAAERQHYPFFFDEI